LTDYKVSFNYQQSTGTATGATGSAPESPIIEFLCDPALEGRIPLPERAIRFAPDWFKRLEREMGVPDAQGLPGLTAKACLPMTDAFSLGFVLPLPFDVQLRIPEDRVSIQMGWAPDVPFQPMEQHHPAQIGAPQPPFQSVMPLKFINPWRIKVPDGYSVLFTQPLSRPDRPATISYRPERRLPKCCRSAAMRWSSRAGRGLQPRLNWPSRRPLGTANITRNRPMPGTGG